ncbi:hypothetical protein [uncultured Gammaproteobacteria bacterium]|nr:hypothetical protein [uncultured Gammaproteobacteria bacterium]
MFHEVGIISPYISIINGKHKAVGNSIKNIYEELNNTLNSFYSQSYPQFSNVNPLFT